MLDLRELDIKVDKNIKYGVSISYIKDGKEVHLPYLYNNWEKFKEYKKCGNINPDVSGITEQQEATEFQAKFMEKYPLPTAKKMEELFNELNQLNIKHHQELTLHGNSHNAIYNSLINIIGYDNISNENVQKQYNFLKRMVQAVAEGKDPKKTERDSNLWDRITNRQLAKGEYHVLSYFFQTNYSDNSQKPYINAEQAKLLLDKMPKECFKSQKEFNKWNNLTVFGSEKFNEGQTKEGLVRLSKEIGDALLQIKIHQIVEQKLKKIISKHLEKQKTEREKAENMKKYQARVRLCRKGLMPAPNETSGKDFNWGDAPKQEKAPVKQQNNLKTPQKQPTTR